MKEKFQKVINYYFKSISFIVALLLGYIIALLLLGVSFYIHEGGHIIYGSLDNKIDGRSSEFVISEWIESPTFSFIKVPKQTKMLEGESSLNFALGGMVIVIIVAMIVSFLLYRRTNKKLYFIFPFLFVYHEIIGNFICGTDNLNGSPYYICQFFSGWWIYPFLLIFISLIAILLYPKVSKLLQKFFILSKNKRLSMLSLLKKFKFGLIINSILVLTFILLVVAALYIYQNIDKDMGGNIFAEIVGIFITVIIIENIISLRGWSKWKQIENKVMEKFVKDIHDFFIDFSNIVKMNKVVCTSDDSEESFNKEINKSLSKQIDEIANSNKLELDKRKKERLIKGDYGNLFAKRYELFNNFEMKYQRYLKPDLHIAIIDIQEQLMSIDLNISLQTKGKNWISEEQFYEVMADRFLKIAKAMKVIKDHGYLKAWV